MADFSGKRILLGVTGGIAVYKSAMLVRRFKECGAEVQVVMSRGAQEFVAPLTFQALSGRPVRTDLWDHAAEAAMGHIELARWADQIVIAPASANLLAQLAHGLASDLLTTLVLASEAPVTLAPAMNRVMWSNPATQENLRTLRERGFHIDGPGEGDQACGEVGAGRMSEPKDIVAALDARQTTPPAVSLRGVSVLVTAGPTREHIDPVRYLSNCSSGKMGFAVAAAALAAGAEVTLVAGPVQLNTPAGVKRVDVQSAQQMHDAVHAHLAGTDIYIGAAAVADYRPTSPADRKVKKKHEAMALELQPVTDILASIAALDDGPFTVGFAAETNDVESYALQKLERKRLDMIAANQVGRDAAGKMRGFDVDRNALLVLWRGGKQVLPLAPKAVLARQLIELVGTQYLERRALGAKRPA